MGHAGWVWLPLVAILSTPTAASALAAQKAAPTDAQLQTDIEHKIAGLKLGSASRITVGVHDHTVMLDGTVPTIWSKQQAIDLARKTAGVEQVNSTLEIARAENDTQLAAAVTHELGTYPRLTVYDFVDGVVRDGALTLSGAVTEPLKSSDLFVRMQKIKGLRDVVNNIKVLPTSSMDDQLRRTIAQRIYNDDAFTNYSLAAPPIHVIVENGHVTLIGIVASDIERRKAESIAHLVSGVFSVDNKIRLASELKR